MTSAEFERAVTGFIKAMDFQLEMIRKGIFRKASANYCREHYRCATGDKFTNTNSPIVLKEMLKRRPDFARWIEVKS